MVVIMCTFAALYSQIFYLYNRTLYFFLFQSRISAAHFQIYMKYDYEVHAIGNGSSTER